MRPTTAPDDRLHTADNIFDLNALRHPDKVFRHPRDVVKSADLTLGEKRAILASWASTQRQWHRALHYGRPPASAAPFQSTRFWRHSASSTANPRFRQAARRSA
jgi:hypothetical protein